MGSPGALAACQSLLLVYFPMKKTTFLLSLVALLGLAACGPKGTATSTPTSTLGTDSAATKVGGTADSALTGTAADATGAANTAPEATPPPARADH